MTRDDETRELVLLAVTGWRVDALGNLILIGGPLGPDVQIQAADRRIVELGCEAARKHATKDTTR